MRSLSGFVRFAIYALFVSLLFTAAVNTTGLSDSPVIDPAVVLTGWSEQLGSTVTNVSVLDFTAATRVGNGWFRPTNPAWLAGAAQFDGVWTPAGWQVVATTSSDRGTLLMALNRGTLTNRLWLGVAVVASSDAELYVDLLDTNALPVVVNLLGNLSGSGITRTNVLTSIPLSDYPTATVIALRRGKGAVTVPLALLAMDEQPAQQTLAGTLTGNNLPSSGSPQGGAGAAASAPGGAALGAAGTDTLTQSAQDQSTGGSVRTTTWYVSVAGGNDSYSGRSRGWNGQHGPFASIGKAMDVATPGDVISIAGGKYPEGIHDNGKPGTIVCTGDVDFSGGK